MRFERQFFSAKPPEETLRLIADFRHLMSWDDSIQSVVPRDEVFGQGAEYDVRVLFSGNPIDMVYTVTVYEPGVRAVLTGVAAKAMAIDQIDVTATDQGARVNTMPRFGLHFHTI